MQRVPSAFDKITAHAERDFGSDVIIPSGAASVYFDALSNHEMSRLFAISTRFYR